MRVSGLLAGSGVAAEGEVVGGGDDEEEELIAKTKYYYQWVGHDLDMSYVASCRFN